MRIKPVEFSPDVAQAGLSFKCQCCGSKLDSRKQRVFFEPSVPFALFYCERCANRENERRAAEEAAEARKARHNFVPLVDMSTDYYDLIKSMGYEIPLFDEEGVYDGNSFFLLRDAQSGEFGYLTFGWGSCSCCDALQACETIAELEQLRDELHTSIRWGTAAELLKWFSEHDWQGDHNHSPVFVINARRHLEQIINPVPADCKAWLASAEAKTIGGSKE